MSMKDRLREKIEKAKALAAEMEALGVHVEVDEKSGEISTNGAAFAHMITNGRTSSGMSAMSREMHGKN